jgi:hypothetical protein
LSDLRRGERKVVICDEEVYDARDGIVVDAYAVFEGVFAVLREQQSESEAGGEEKRKQKRTYKVNGHLS